VTATAAAPVAVTQSIAIGTGYAGLAQAVTLAGTVSIRAALTAGPFPPGAGANGPSGTGTWANPGNALADDGLVATWAVP